MKGKKKYRCTLCGVNLEGPSKFLGGDDAKQMHENAHRMELLIKASSLIQKLIKYPPAIYYNLSDDALQWLDDYNRLTNGDVWCE